jgi:hypothetical protein
MIFFEEIVKKYFKCVIDSGSSRNLYVLGARLING